MHCNPSVSAPLLNSNGGNLRRKLAVICDSDDFDVAALNNAAK